MINMFLFLSNYALNKGKKKKKIKRKLWQIYNILKYIKGKKKKILLLLYIHKYN